MARVPYSDDEGLPYEGSRVGWLDPLIVLVDTAAFLTQRVAVTLKAHVNADIDDELFIEDASREIEWITTEDEDG